MQQLKKRIKAKKKLSWKEVFAGEKAFNQTGEWLPQETLRYNQRIFNCD